jgi:hypothetical protein
MFDDDEPPVRLIDPQQEVLTGIGYHLDAVGELPDVNLPRDAGETDASYRERLDAKLSSWLDAFTLVAATGEYLDLWFGTETTAPDDTQPNHVRDAVRANRGEG